MQQVGYLIYVGNSDDAAQVKDNPDWVIVHACKTAHKAEIGYEKSLAQDHPSYLIHMTPGNDQEIFLNMVDMKAELLPQYTDPILRAAFHFISGHVAAGKKILVHCDQGNSRGPSVAMAYLARGGEYNHADYESTSASFKEQYESFEPNDGIMLYMKKHWNRILGF